MSWIRGASEATRCRSFSKISTSRSTNPFVSAEDLFFVRLQFRRDEALAAGDRLLAVVVSGHAGEIRSRHLDVVPEDAIEADLERVDPGARPFGFLHLRDPPFARAADAAEIVQLRIDAVAHDSAVPRVDRRLIQQRALELVAHISEIVELGREAANERGLEWFQEHADAGSRRQGLTQGHEIAWTCRSERRARHETLDVVHALQRFANLRALGAAKREFLDGIQPILDAFERQQRPEQPGADQSAAHGGERPIDFLQQRSGAATIRRFDHLEVPERRRIDHHRVGARPEREVADVRQFGLLCFAEVLDKRTRGTGCRAVVFETEALERLRAQLCEQRRARGFELERPAVCGRDTGFQAQLVHKRRHVIEAGGRQDFAWPEHRQLVGERLARVASRVLGRREFAC